MMTTCSSNLLLLVLVCSLYFVSAGVRRRRQPQDFVFPDDTQPGGIPTWLLQSSTDQPPIFQPNPETNPPSRGTSTTVAPTSPGRSTPSPKTTPSPEFLQCFMSCPTTSEYNPICGTNQEVYLNEQKFFCAQRCGAVVDIARRGNCRGLFS